jgi:VWFA-related protein
MRSSSVVSVCALLLFPVFSVGQKRPNDVPTFTSRTELVTVPVVVLKRGNPMRQLRHQGWIDEHVTGLAKEAFEIEEDGERKPIAFFEEIGNETSPIDWPAPEAPGVFTNRISSKRPVTMIVILLDLINTPYLYQQGAKKRLLEYLQRDFRADRPTMLVAIHPNGLKVLHDFTTDPRILAEIVRRLTSSNEHDPALDNQVVTEFSHGIATEFDIAAEYARIEREFFNSNPTGPEAYSQQFAGDKLQTTFYQLQQLAQALSAVRGMKSLVWATGGFVLPNQMDSKSRRIVDEYVHTLKLLSAAGIAVYPIDTVLQTDNPSYSSAQFHVNVRGEGLQVQARSGYFSADIAPNNDDRRKRDIAQAFAMPVEYRGLPFTVRWIPSTSAAAGSPLSPALNSSDPNLQQRHPQTFMIGVRQDALTIDAADNNHLKLDVVVLALDREGKVLADVTQQIDLHPTAPELDRLRNKGFAYTNKVMVPARASKVRFIVRDDLSGRLGTLSVPVDAHLQADWDRSK